VANDAQTTVTLTDAPDADAIEVIAGGLRAYDEVQAGYSDWRPLAILVRHPQTKAVAGGLLGRTSLGLLRVDQFFLPEGLRRNRLGGRILAMAEDEARRRSCTRAVLSMVHFQAPGFYLKQGWEVAARIDCEPPGHTRFYMTNKLSRLSAAGGGSGLSVAKRTSSSNGTPAETNFGTGRKPVIPHFRER
jgi:GNAT superfamily N-acetyltransferase